MSPIEKSQIETIALEKLRVACSVCIDLCQFAFFRNHLEATAVIEDGARRLVMQLHSQILSKTVREEEGTVLFRCPADWWQAVRERWAPKWWLRRHPVRYREERIVTRRAVYHLCPHIDITTRDGHPVHYAWLVRGDTDRTGGMRWVNQNPI